MSKSDKPVLARPPASKSFPWRCGHCRERAVQPTTLSYTTAMEHDGRTYTVNLPALQAPRCEKCGELVLDGAANRQISDALRHQLGLLTPEQMRQNREALGLTQKQLASQLGVAEATVSRWETGAQIQQRSLDRLLRLFFAFANVRSALADEGRIPELGVPMPAGRPSAPDTSAIDEATAKALAESLLRSWTQTRVGVLKHPWFVARLPAGGPEDTEQAAWISRLASQLDELPKAKKPSVLEEFSRLVDLMKE
jgi:putative zinc finger/helix-turn-helix YgiT family protein